MDINVPFSETAIENPLDEFPLTAVQVHESLSPDARALRRRFIKSYLDDYNRVDAAIRIGYPERMADQMSKQFLREPYTLQYLEEMEKELGISNDEDRHRRKIVTGLYREAFNKFNTGSARVSALVQLAKIMGIEAPVKTEVNMTQHKDLSMLSNDDLKSLRDIVAKTNG